MAQRTHPHAEATYRVNPIEDGAFAVEVSIPERHPAKVSPFATKPDAEAWITKHQQDKIRKRAEQLVSQFQRQCGQPSRLVMGRRDRSAPTNLLNPPTWLCLPRCALASSERRFVS